MTRKRRKRDNSKPKDELSRTLRKRRWLWMIGLGTFAALLGGLVGLAANARTMLLFMLIGFALGAFGGWFAGSADIWPYNKGKRRRGTSLYWYRNFPPGEEPDDDYINVD